MPDRPSSDIAFTASVKAAQARKGSREANARMEEAGGWDTTITPELAVFIADQTSFFLGTASADGQPYIQHRGGPAGFLQVLDEKTLAFADFRGNRQYITTGNLSENPKAILFLICYATQYRFKIWGTARLSGDAGLIAKLMPQGYRARPEQAIVFSVEAWDVNCPQHIPRKFDAADVKKALEEKDRRIAELEAELSRLRSA
jgi:predicted pyridoxine 5'-phosphate oxidase superfamily flavin-nucleotide-binding protein